MAANPFYTKNDSSPHLKSALRQKDVISDGETSLSGPSLGRGNRRATFDPVREKEVFEYSDSSYFTTQSESSVTESTVMGGQKGNREIVYSYSQGKFIKRENDSDISNWRLLDGKERYGLFSRQSGTPVYKTQKSIVPVYSESSATQTRTDSYPTYSSTYYTYGSPDSDTSYLTSNSYTSGSSREIRKPVTVRRYRFRPSSAQSYEGYDAKLYRSTEPGSWRIIQKPNTISEIPEQRNVKVQREVIRKVPWSPRSKEVYCEQTTSDYETDTSYDSETDVLVREAESDRLIIERGFQDRMQEYKARTTKDVGTQMVTHYVVEPEPRPQTIARDVNTQTVNIITVRSPKLPKDRYKTAVIEAEPKKRQPNSDDEIEVVVIEEPELATEVVREQPSPGPNLIEEIDLRPPPPPPTVDPGFGPKRKYIPPPPPPPAPDVLIRVGGGWMKEEHHRIQHRPLQNKLVPTSDRIPFMRSSFFCNKSKLPVVNKQRKQTDKLRYASFIA